MGVFCLQAMIACMSEIIYTVMAVHPQSRIKSRIFISRYSPLQYWIHLYFIAFSRIRLPVSQILILMAIQQNEAIHMCCTRAAGSFKQLFQMAIWSSLCAIPPSYCKQQALDSPEQVGYVAIAKEPKQPDQLWYVAVENFIKLPSEQIISLFDHITWGYTI